MNSLFRNALEPWGLWALMALLPLAVLALYFLKLRREPVEVPSTYLWQKSIEDLHVNSLWQRLRRSLLLFLQLLLLALGMLALLRPGWEGTRLEGQRMIFMIDNSASMGATDLEGDKSRLAAAKEHVRALIDQMDSDMLAMIISFSDESRVEQGFTSNRRKLREQLEKIELTSRPTNLRGGLELADGLANPVQAADSESANEAEETPEQTRGDKTALYIFSDGRFAAVKDFSLDNLEPQFYVPLGQTDANNLAITAFSTRRSEVRPEDRQAFVQVSNFSAAAHTAVVELSHEGTFLDARELEVPAGESRGVTFSLTGTTTGGLVAKISDESARAAGDVLEIDNTAYAVMNASALGRVLIVTPGNDVLETALATDRIARLAEIEQAEPAILETEAHQELADNGAYDLIIYDQCAPAERMPRGNTLFIGRPPPRGEWRPPSDSQARDEDEALSDEGDDSAPAADGVPRVSRPQIIDYAREHPLLAYVELGDIYIERSYLVAPPPGGVSLIDSTDGPIFAIAPRDGFEDAVLGFEILVAAGDGQRINTNWYNRHSFPTFVLNAIDYFVGDDQEGMTSSHLPGSSLELRTRSLASKLTVLGPNNLRREVARTGEGTYLFRDTQSTGLYEVVDGQDVVGRFAVNLFDGQESNVRLEVHPDDSPDDRVQSIASLQIGHVEVEAPIGGPRPARQDLWRPLLLLAVVVLLVEWYIYNRRVYL